MSPKLSAGKCTPYGSAADVSVFSGKLAVGIECPVDAGLPAAYIHGALRVTDTTTLSRLQFVEGATPTLTADAPAGQLGLVGSLRVSEAVGIGIDPSTLIAQQARLVIQGAASDARPLQIWQNSAEQPLAQLDTQGQLSIGAPVGNASLSVRTTFRIKLQGKISGKADVKTLTGSETKFMKDLVKGDVIAVMIGANPTLFTVASTPIIDTEVAVTEAPADKFSDSSYYVEAPPLALVTGAGKELLDVDRRGHVRVGGGLSGASGSLTISGGLTIQQGDANIAKQAEVYPSIGFAQTHGFKHRIDALPDGFHFKGGQPNSDGYVSLQADTITATKFTGEGAFVAGMIVMWSGAPDQLPSGWALCDGQNNRPNLVDRFVVGAGQQFPINTKGGASTHQHNVNIGTATTSYQGGGSRIYGGGAVWFDWANHHSHTVDIGSKASSDVSNIPPYYALAYIIKL